MTLKNPGVNLDAAVALFGKVSRPVLYEWLGTKSCIGSSRVTCNVFHRLGIEAYPVATQWTVHVPDLKVAYVSGFDDSEKKHLQTAHKVHFARGVYDKPGYDGHVVVVAGKRYLIDPSFDQSLEYLARYASLPGDVDRQTLCIGPQEDPVEEDFYLRAAGAFEDGTKLEMTYKRKSDLSFLLDEAWTDPDLDLVTRFVIGKMISYGLTESVVNPRKLASWL